MQTLALEKSMVMLLHTYFFYFIYYLKTTLANSKELEQLILEANYNLEETLHFVEFTGVNKGKAALLLRKNHCAYAGRNEFSPFIVFVLYKTSGHFLAMGSILDKRTVITAEIALKIPYISERDILVLAGSLRPWWGKNSQVRKVKKVVVSNFEVALLSLFEDWDFNKHVAPIKIPHSHHRFHTPIYGNFALIFGLTLPESFSGGEEVPKTQYYHMSLNRAVHELWDECIMTYLDLRAEFNRTMHYCIYSNDTFCYGGIGSPSVGVTTLGELHIMGVLIRNSCQTTGKFGLVIKIDYIDKWIKVNSLLGHSMPSFVVGEKE